jgi:hypothetical protein
LPTIITVAPNKSLQSAGVMKWIVEGDTSPGHKLRHLLPFSATPQLSLSLPFTTSEQ